MNSSAFQSDRFEESPEQRMWKAVLASTVGERISGPLRQSHVAEDYLFNNELDFRQVCECAGLNPGLFRSRLQRLRKTTQAKAA